MASASSDHTGLVVINEPTLSTGNKAHDTHYVWVFDMHKVSCRSILNR